MAITTGKIDELLRALLVLTRAVEQVLETDMVEDAVSLPLSFSKVQILRLLWRRRGQSSTQVARFLSVTKPAVTQIVDAMIRSNLVTRKTAKGDRREVLIALTPRGREVFHKIQNAQRHCLRTVATGKSQRTFNRWASVLEELAVELVRADKHFHDFCMQCGAHGDGSCVLTGGSASCAFLSSTKRAH